MKRTVKALVRRKRNLRKWWCLFTLIVMAVLITFYFEHLEWFKGNEFVRAATMYLDGEDFGIHDRDPEVDCVFPLPDPLNPEIMPFFKKANPIHCSWIKSYLAEMDRGTLKLNKSAHTASDWFPCRYSEISRPDNDHHVIYGPYRKLVDPVVPKSDFVYVECNNVFGVPLYQDFFAYAKRNESVRKFRSDEELSVAMIGIDSMSRMNFIRQMPRSYRYLKNVLGGITMLGFNKVGRNTFPNVIPMLTGEKPPKATNHGHFESFRFIWHKFSEAEAATTYAEDWPTANMFEIWGSGLKKQPTHHYLQTFYRAYQNTIMESLSAPKCLGGRPLHHYHFAYLLSVLRVYEDSPSFMFTLHNGLSHDLLNTPQLLDTDFRNFLKKANDEGLFNRTLLIVYGDHGQRVDDVRVTEAGRVEDHMPLVSLVLPDSIKPSWREALLRNRNRLTASFDLYQTLVDVLSTLVTVDKSDVEALKRTGGGRSLFSEIPKNRTCDDALIEDRYCMCSNANQTVLSVDHEECVETVSSWIRSVNKEMIDTEKCAEIRLNKILLCKRTLRTVATKTYLVSFRTEPGGAVFEAITDWADSAIRQGDIHRINRYAEQSYCITANSDRTRKMKELCYCL